MVLFFVDHILSIVLIESFWNSRILVRYFWIISYMLIIY